MATRWYPSIVSLNPDVYVDMDDKKSTVAARHHRKRSSLLSFTITWTPEDLDKQLAKEDGWKAGRGEWLVLLCLTEMCLVVALDATIVVPVLPVGCILCCLTSTCSSITLVNCLCTQW